jgi:hypothetical protein
MGHFGLETANKNQWITINGLRALGMILTTRHTIWSQGFP